MSVFERRKRIRQIAERKYNEMERRDQLAAAAKEKAAQSRNNTKLSTIKLSSAVELKIQMRRQQMRQKAEKKFADMLQDEQSLGGTSPNAPRQTTYVVNDVKRSRFLPLPEIKSEPQVDQNSGTITDDVAADSVFSNTSKADGSQDSSKKSHKILNFTSKVRQHMLAKDVKAVRPRALESGRSMSEADAVRYDAKHKKLLNYAAGLQTKDANMQLKSRARAKLPAIKPSVEHPKQAESQDAKSQSQSPRARNMHEDVKTDARIRYTKLEKDMLYFLERQNSFNVKHPVLHPHSLYAWQRNKTRVNGMLSEAAKVNEHLRPIKATTNTRKAWQPVGV